MSLSALHPDTFTSLLKMQFGLLMVVRVFQHNELGDVCPLLVFVNPKSGGMKGRELLYSFRKLLNPHQVFDISNGGPLAG